MIPKLRFPGFSGEWKVKKLGVVADFRRGSFPQPYGLPKWYDDNGAPFVQVFDVGNDFRLKPDTKRHISAAAQSMSVKIPKGSLIITIQGSIGRVAVTQYDAYVDRTLLFIRSTKIDLSMQLLSYLLFLKFEDEKRKAPGGTIKTITKEALGAFNLSFPANIDEQQKIAEFLMTVDARVSAVEKKVKLLQQYKKGIMQKIFTQQIRFKDEDGGSYPDWQEKKLSEIVNKIAESYNSATSKEIYITIELESLGQGTGKLLQTFPSSQQKSVKTKFSKGDVLYGKLRPYLRKFYFADFDGVCTSEIWVLRPKEIENKYLFQLVQSNIFSAAVDIQSGSRMPRADWRTVSNKVFGIPNKAEQQKIADFLGTLDDKINAEEAKLEQAKAFKKSLLQRIFV
jgi:type I restriction enzyme S subunit